MPEFIAIVGAPGSGKSRLADTLKKSLGRQASIVSLSDFTREGADPNTPEPGAVDWSALDVALGALREDQPTEAPHFDPATGQCKAVIIKPTPLIILEGSWLLHIEVLRSLFSLSLFIHCPADVCLQRLIERDSQATKRSPEDMRTHFREVIEPVIQRYIMPQATHADRIITSPPTAMDLDAITADCRKLLKSKV